MSAPAGSASPFTAMQQVPSGHFDFLEFSGKIMLVDSQEAVSAGLAALAGSEILGFDLEWTPEFTRGQNNPIALLQLANQHTAVLFDVISIGIPPALRDVLIRDRPLKVGVIEKSDVNKLWTHHQLSLGGAVNIATMAKELGYHRLGQLVPIDRRSTIVRSISGLSSLSEQLLGKKLRKSKKLTMAAWGRVQLTYPLQMYAATDAWVGRELAVRLVYKSIEAAKAAEAKAAAAATAEKEQSSAVALTAPSSEAVSSTVPREQQSSTAGASAAIVLV